MTIRTLLSSYVSGFRFYRGFLLPYFVMLRKVAPDVSHHLPSGLLQRLLLSLDFQASKPLSKAFHLEIHFRSVSIPSDFVRQFGCLSCFQKDYLHNLHDSLLFRYVFAKATLYQNRLFNFDTDIYGTFGASMVRSIRSKIIKKINCSISITHVNFDVNINRLYYHITVYPFI